MRRNGNVICEKRWFVVKVVYTYLFQEIDFAITRKLYHLFFFSYEWLANSNAKAPLKSYDSFVDSFAQTLLLLISNHLQEIKVTLKKFKQPPSIYVNDALVNLIHRNNIIFIVFFFNPFLILLLSTFNMNW